ncbi:MAG: LytTR family transcriptional regulator [Chitinophagaceae bacterium]|nr:MAG: LytTR family transcriptional regulator [Chitinophagaceae bacterium]
MRPVLTDPFGTFLLPTDRGVKVIAIENLVRIEALSNYSKLHFSNGNKLVVARVLRQFEESLKAYGFLRIHHKHLVNMNWLVEGKKDANVILLRNGEMLLASRRKKKGLQADLDKWFHRRGNGSYQNQLNYPSPHFRNAQYREWYEERYHTKAYHHILPDNLAGFAAQSNSERQVT